MRVFAGALGTETNSFSPLPTGLAAFEAGEHYPAGTHPARMTGFGAPLMVARERAAAHGWTLIEGLVTSAPPGGTTTRVAYETLRDTLLEELRAAMPVDMVVLGLHGAMIADGYDDCEGDLLARMRAIAGPEASIGATLDPHGHLTELMVASADILVLFKEYPHSDIVPRAYEMVDLVHAVRQGRVRPTSALVDCQMVVPIHTTREPGRGLVSRMQRMEAQDGVLTVSLAQGFATGDTPEMGTRVLVTTDGDPALARRLARDLADEVIAAREQLLMRYLDVEGALDRALAAPRGPVVLADRSDNPGSGAAGDSTYLLRAMLNRGMRDAAIGPMWDPGAVRIAHEAGVGAHLALRVGGKVGPLSGDPVDLDCVVRAVCPDMRATGLSNTSVALGDAALVHADGIDIVLVTRRTQGFHTDLFTGLGCDVAGKHVIVVKSAQHFYEAFAAVASEVLYVAAPGSASPDWTTLPYRKIAQPKWPIS
jgi:microcystin degradation protein MlrC